MWFILWTIICLGHGHTRPKMNEPILGPDLASELSEHCIKEDDIMNPKKNGSVMVVGAGIAGIQASLDLADSGYLVYLVDKEYGHRRDHGPAGQNLSHQ